jgi:membrane protein YdbS with pleckstrin-like domain
MNSNEESEFANPSVLPENVPDYHDVGFEPPASGFRRYTLVSTSIFAAPVILAALVAWILPFIPLAGWKLLVIAAGVVTPLVLVGVYRWIDAGYRGWALREHDIIARSGVLWRSVTALPVARIQHVETTHGPLERAYDLARLKLYTAGGLTADLVVIGLDRETADKLREYLVEQIRKRDAETSQSSDD